MSQHTKLKLSPFSEPGPSLLPLPRLPHTPTTPHTNSSLLTQSPTLPHPTHLPNHHHSGPLNPSPPNSPIISHPSPTHPRSPTPTSFPFLHLQPLVAFLGPTKFSPPQSVWSAPLLCISPTSPTSPPHNTTHPNPNVNALSQCGVGPTHSL